MKVILINGPPGSGKDTAAKLISYALPSVRDLKLSKPLKEAFIKLLQLDGESADLLLGKDKDSKISGLNDMTPREVLIELSEHFCKPLFGEGFFGKIAAHSMRSIPSRVVTISDAGFDVEVKPIFDKFLYKDIYLIELHRKGRDFSKDSRSYLDRTQFSPKNVAVINNNYELDMFQVQIERTLEKWKLRSPSQDL